MNDSEGIVFDSRSVEGIARNLRIGMRKLYYTSLQRLASPHKMEKIEPLQVRDICMNPLPEISLRSISGYQKFVPRTNLFMQTYFLFAFASLNK